MLTRYASRFTNILFVLKIVHTWISTFSFTLRIVHFQFSVVSGSYNQIKKMFYYFNRCK